MVNLQKLGTGLVVGGSIALIYEPKFGMIALAIGAFCFIMGNEEKETKKEEKKEESVKGEPHYRVVGNTMLELDENGKVLGSCALPPEQPQRKRIGSNK